MKSSFVYILTNKNNNVFYVGVTTDLEKRLYEHKNKIMKGFTEKYNVDKLVYFEGFTDVEDAIQAEKKLKNWHREWKMNLIKKSNPEFNDLSVSLSSS